MHSIRQTMPGFTIALIVALAAMFLNGHYGAPTMLFALLLGLAIGFLNDSPKIQPGIAFTAKKLLRIGVALLGLRIALSDVTALGLKPVLLIIVGVFSTIAVGLVLAKLLGFRKRFGVLTGGAVAICGASAAMAISSVMPKEKGLERDTIFAVVGVTTLSTLAMIVYPIITNYLGYSDSQAGLFMGGTIHDVAQVIGAGFSVSQETGELSTLTKMMRVAMLVPVVMMIAFAFQARAKASGSAHSGTAPTFPFFLLAFIGLVLLNSFVDIPTTVKDPLINLSKFCLVISIVAIGIKTRLQEIFELGIKPIILIVLETLWIAILFLVAIPYL
ncbi:YeiH family protein [Temperatibacter marinus]|uniref:YeiH family protein n=1 Tax=Temperatibacter marinus TaxID=1456591 RepID=UPI0035C66985